MGVVIDPSQPDASSYIESLQRRVQQLEVAARRTPNSSATPGRRASDASEQQHEDDHAGSEDHSASHTNGEGLEATMHAMDYLPLSAMAEDRQQASLQQYSFQTFLNAAIEVSGSNPAQSNDSNSALSGSIEALYQALIPKGLKLSRSLLELPVQNYLSICDVLCPFLDRDDFFARYAQIVDNLETAQTDQTASQCPHHITVVYAALATSILVSPDYRHKESISLSLAQTACRLLPRVVAQSDNASIVRALIALSLYSTYTTLGGSTWHLIGLALARAMSAGMHTEGVSNYKAPDPEKRENGRLFWSLYVLDA